MKNILSIAMLPLAGVYSLLSCIRDIITVSYQSSVPIICVGNVTMGGTGKTPVVQRLTSDLAKQGFKKIIVVSRGYGGSIVEPTLVNLKKHTAIEVGDEPLLLGMTTYVVVAKNKRKGVKLAEKLGADIIVLDDGLQNPTVRKTKIIVVVDGYKGFGNGFVVPAGTLRELPKKRLQQADAIVVTGTVGKVFDDIKSTYPNKTYFGKYTSTIRPFENNTDNEPQSVIPFAGLGNPDKFFETVRLLGYPICAKVSYPDHHFYSDMDLQDLHGIANKAMAKLLTTEKDYIRLTETQKIDITPLCISMNITPDNLTQNMIKDLNK